MNERPAYEAWVLREMVDALLAKLRERITAISGKRATVESLAHHAKLVIWRELLVELDRAAHAPGVVYVQLEPRQATMLAEIRGEIARW